jgi:enamine deaminase RidA (YjgF/YER057c/UK114 family)
MTVARFSSPDGLPPTAGYSHVAAVPGGSRLVFVSGQIAANADGTIVAPGDWEAQTRQVMRNIERALGAEDATWSDVVKLTFFVTDTSALATVRSVRDEFVDTTAPPASSLVKVAGLVQPDLLIEVEAVAACGPAGTRASG